MKQERKQSLKKTKLSRAIKEIHSLDLQKAAESRYAKLLAENNLSHPMLESHLRQSILPAVAVYGALLSAGISKETAFQVIRGSVLEAAKPMAKMFRTFGRLPFFFRFSEKCALCQSGWSSVIRGGIWNGNGTTAAELNGIAINVFMRICLNTAGLRN